MATILRNSDKNKIKVLYFPKDKIIRKITFNKKYYRYLNNEINGLQWYSKLIKEENNILDFGQNSNFYFLDVKIFNSKKKVFYRSIIENENLIKSAINHYTKIWPTKEHVYYHGDLTVDNILFNGKKIKFIDWELSGNSEIWGYDLVYLLISSIFFPYDINKNLTNNEKKVFKKLWFQLKVYDISKELLKDPLRYFKKIYKKKKWKRTFVDHPNKIYPKIIDRKFREILKNLII